VSIFVDKRTRVVVLGITGSAGSFHTGQMMGYGTNVVAGVTPGKGGQDVEGIPVFETVDDAVAATGANTSLIYVPARFAAEAIYEAADRIVGDCSLAGLRVKKELGTEMVHPISALAEAYGLDLS